jgi:hypothetical protein
MRKVDLHDAGTEATEDELDRRALQLDEARKQGTAVTFHDATSIMEAAKAASTSK